MNAQDTDVAIIGAGPYGLSLSAHLTRRGVRHRIFGDPMRFWRDMPEGINLKSLAFATNIEVPTRGYSFPQWCRERGLEDFEPCTMKSFATYGCEMQQRFVPQLEEVFVSKVEQRDRQFQVTLATGAAFRSARVVCCTGLSGLSYIPDVLRNLGPDRMKHTFDISDYGPFRNMRVAVIGAGASAIEAGTLVREAGGTSDVFVRGKEAVIHGRAPRSRPLWRRLKDPTSVLGASRTGWVLQHFPLIVHRMPLDRRTRFIKGHYGPASPWWIRDRVIGIVPIHVRHELVQAEDTGDGVRLTFHTGDGSVRMVEVDYVIAGTGYDVDVQRLTYLDSHLARQVRCIERAPELNAYFESSVPGLHFVGTLSFMSFGPLFRFVCGAAVTSPRLARHFG
jgi:cation diffusion facilitator CzcD-associated flavoprotein CzcO